MTINNYDSLSEWLGSELHIKNCDIGPRGDVPEGKVSITGDRWRHQRLGYAYAPGSTLTQAVKSASIESILFDQNIGDTAIRIYATDRFEIGDRIYIEDLTAGNNEVQTITGILDAGDNPPFYAYGELRFAAPGLVNNYETEKNFQVSQVKAVKVQPNSNIITPDYCILESKDLKKSVICDNHADSDESTININKLTDDFSVGDTLRVLNSNTKWVRDSDNPIYPLQRNQFWDWAGYGVKSAEFLPEVDIEEDEKGNELWTKPGLWFTGQRETSNPQIGLLLSEEETDIENWTQFLGVKNTAKDNPVIRHSDDTERFAYTSDAALQKVWNTEDANITAITAPLVASTTVMKITYDDDGEVWGLMPVPMNAEARSTSSTATDNVFRCEMAGNVGNASGDVYITLVAADGTCYSHNFANVLQNGSCIAYTFDYSDFDGRHYITAIVVGISLPAGIVGTDDLIVDRVRPFVGAVWDELVADPTVIQGADPDTDEAIGTFACYYTARERPREILTNSPSLDGETSGTISMASTANFDAGDIVVIYDRNEYEIGEVENVIDGNDLHVKHVAYDEDNSAVFEYDYSTTRQAMIANNTYRVSKIGGAYVLTDDVSNYVKYITDDNSRPIFEPSSTATDWDAEAVKHPCVRRLGNTLYMAYVGVCASNTQSIGFARSSDYVTWTRLEGNPFIEPGVGDFDSDNCFHPDLFLHPPRTILTYAGDNGTNISIGSAIHTSDFHSINWAHHVSILIYPMASLGNPPESGLVLFDMGNYKVEVTKDNTLLASAYVDGQWHNTDGDNNFTNPSNAFGTYLVHDHWNLVIAQYIPWSKQLSVHRVTAMPHVNKEEYFTKSPWILSEDAEPGDTTITAMRQFGSVDGITDFEGTGQDVMLWGEGTDFPYTDTEQFQVGRIVGVSAIGDDEWVCDLANPIGPWGFSNRNIRTEATWQSGATFQGIMLAQGHQITLKQAYPWLEFLDPSSDPNKIFSSSTINSKDLWGGIGQDARPLDSSKAFPPVVGSDQDGKRSWNLGYFGHIDVGTDVLSYRSVQVGSPPVTWGGRVDLYNDMVNQGTANSTKKPVWYKFNLSADGQTPDIHNNVAYWDLTDWDTGKFPDKVSNNHLYLTGSAAQNSDGFMGDTFKNENQTTDSAEANLITDNFTKLGTAEGDTQFDKDSSGWDATSVSTPHLFRSKDAYRLVYTGTGKIAYETEGEIIGDLYEASAIKAGVTIDASFEILTGTTVTVYLSWEKKTEWDAPGHKIWESATPGTQTIVAQYWALPGVTTDFVYNVRWRILLESNPAGTNSPVVNSFQVEYTEPDSFPSTAFLDAQDQLTQAQPEYRAQLVISSGASIREKYNITEDIVSIDNITQEVPIEPDALGDIVTGDVTITVENTKSLYSELATNSYFYNRLYIDDEIRIFSGFNLSTGNEFYTSGRFLINKIDVNVPDTTAQIYCRALLREPMDTIVGLKKENQEKPLVFKGQQSVKTIMESLLTDSTDSDGNVIGASLDIGDVYIEDYDRDFSNVTINERSINETLQLLAKACDGVVYTNNQGDVYFRTWSQLDVRALTVKPDINMQGLRYTGQDRDRIVYRSEVKGAPLVQGSCTSPDLSRGKIVNIENDYIQRSDWADTIAENIITRYNKDERIIELWSVYLPSLRILDTVTITEETSGLASASYLVNFINKSITEFTDNYRLTSNLAPP
jgi:hypothetical protein